jgi:hypothetical protein
MNVPPEELDGAVALVREHWHPAAARLQSIRLIRFLPVETLWHTIV